MISIEKYREYNPYTETILTDTSGDLIVIDRYGPDDFGAWWTDAEHLYDDTFGSSVRGTLEAILHELKNKI